MIFNLVLGAIAGAATRYAEAPIGAALKGKFDFDDRDLRVMAFVILLLAAALLIWVSGADGKPLALLIGGGIGVFATALMKLGREQKDRLQTRLKERNEAAEGSTTTATTAKKSAAKKAPARKTAAKKMTD